MEATADAAEGLAPTTRRETVFGVVGLGVALLSLTAAVAMILFAHREQASIDGDQMLSELFARADLPFGLELAEAGPGPGGERMLRFEVPGTPAEEPAAEPEEGESAPKVDWASLTGPEGTPPVGLLVVTHPIRRADDAIERFMRGDPDVGGGDGERGERGERGGGGGRDRSFGGGGDGIRIPDSGGAVVLERGEVPWGDYAAKFLLRREFEPGGTFRDTMRANLSTARTPCVIVARWPRGHVASKERLEELIAGLVPHAAEPADAGSE